MNSMKPTKSRLFFKEINLCLAGMTVLLASLYHHYLLGVRNFPLILLALEKLAIFIMIPPLIIYLITSSRKRWRYLETFQRLLLVCLLCSLIVTLVFIEEGYSLRDFGFKKRIMACGELDQIQTEVERFIATLPSDVPYELPYEIWSERIKCINPSRVLYRREPRPYLVYNWGGGFESRGIFVGDSSFHIKNDSADMIIRQWKPGFYSWFRS